MKKLMFWNKNFYNNNKLPIYLILNPKIKIELKLWKINLTLSLQIVEKLKITILVNKEVLNKSQTTRSLKYRT